MMLSNIVLHINFVFWLDELEPSSCWLKGEQRFDRSFVFVGCINPTFFVRPGSCGESRFCLEAS